MTHHPRDSDELEHTLLEHYRRHTQQAPSAELDARILAAAQAHAQAHVQAQQRPLRQPLLSRLQGWLFGGSQRARWSMAFASIATLGIGVGLAMRTLEQAPAQQYDGAPLSFSAPAPAPAMALAPKAEVLDPDASQKQVEKKVFAEESARARPEMRKQAAPVIISGQLNEQLDKAEAAAEPGAAPFADAAVPAAPSALASKAKAASVTEQAQLQRSLKQILQLQRSGQAELAKEQLHTLQQLHPQLDLPAQLQRLRQEQGLQ
ncbi:hypothetical protein ACVW0Y_001817 [Pseudomonas sp. TE3786]